MSYVHWDCEEVVKKYCKKPNALLMIDGPYLRTAYGFPCDDYSNSFSYKQYEDMFKMLTSKGAKCKAIVFHYYTAYFHDMITSYGFECVGNYGKDEKRTCIYSLRIDPKNKFFVPSNKKEPCDSPNTQPDSGISSEKGVL